MVLAKHPVTGRSTNLDNSRARAYCAFSSVGEGCLDIFLWSIISLLVLLLWETVRYRLKCCFKRPLNSNN